uniref:Uncharacterized protein n=2 Tax=Aegilops tauschii TaxID=37682 RepID=A0A453AVU4_AEGTS
MASSSAARGLEHRVEVPAAACGSRQGTAAAPEKWLNCFVGVVALMERVGNALGTLAFTWATVVLLGGYPTVLRPVDDFWCAATIVFLEALRYVCEKKSLQKATRKI